MRPIASIFNALAAALLAASAPAHAAEPQVSALDAISREVGVVFEKARGAVVRIEADDVFGPLVGTGFFVEPNGTLITSYGVGGEAEEMTVHLGDEQHSAKRLMADKRSGMAILKIELEKPCDFLRFGKATTLGIGSAVIAVGYPLDLPVSPSLGFVSGFDMGVSGRFFAARHIRATAPVQRGQGGSPLLGTRGELMGIVISTLENGGGLFALPSEAVEKVYHDFLRFGRVRQGWLGADIRLSDAPEHGSAARVRNLRLDGPGYRGGLRPGDVILGVGTWPVRNPEDVLNASFYVIPDDELKVRVSRATRILDLTLSPGESPDGKGAEPGIKDDVLVPVEQAGLKLGK